MSETIEINRKLIDEKFSAMQTLLSAIYPSLITFYCMCDKRPVKGVTIRLNTKYGISPVIEYGPKFIEYLSIPVFACLISIELFRLLLHHPTSRLMHPLDRTLRASNVVCTDPKILAFKIPESIQAEFPSLDMIEFMDPSFNRKEDCYLEKIFSILSNNDNNNNTDDNANDGMSNGGSSSDNNDSDDFESESDAIKKHFTSNNNAKNTEGWGENEMIDAQVAEAVNRQSIKDWGNLPAHLKEKIQEANAKKFDPRTIIKRFVKSVIANWYKFNRMKVYRRDVELSGIFPGKVHGEQSKVLFAVDSSASMAEEQIAKAIGVFQSAFRHGECYYCFWDAACSQIVKEEKTAKNVVVEGGGGTNPQCVIDKINEEKLRFDGIVFITDCYFRWDKPNTKASVFILQTDDATDVPEWCRAHLKMSDVERL